jgi:tetratricopeptide (TPR) repeat protein
MKSVSKLKDDGRRHEQREEWEKAIQVYLQVLRISEESETEVELPLFNRIGDLCVRLGRDMDAVRYYEQAADRYADAGLYNNAIALCNKALRYDPDRLELMKKLGQFSASQGFVTDARRYFLEYAERQFNSGHIDDALNALEDFANVSEDAEVRELLGRRLHAHGRLAEAVAELERARELRIAAGESSKAQALRAEIEAIDPSASFDDEAAAPKPAGADPVATEDVATDELPELIDLNDSLTLGASMPGSGAVETPGSARMEGLETGHFEPPAADEGFDGIEIEDYSTTPDEPGYTIEGLESTTLDIANSGAGLEPLDLGFDVVHDEPAFDLPLLDDDDDEGPGFDLPLLDDEADDDDDVMPTPPDFEFSGGEPESFAPPRVFEAGDDEDPWGLDTGETDEDADETEGDRDFDLPLIGDEVAGMAPTSAMESSSDMSLDALLADLRVDDLLDAEAASHEAGIGSLDVDTDDDDVALEFAAADEFAFDGVAEDDSSAEDVAIEDTAAQSRAAREAQEEQAAATEAMASSPPSPSSSIEDEAFWYDDDADLPASRILDDVASDAGPTFELETEPDAAAWTAHGHALFDTVFDADIERPDDTVERSDDTVERPDDTVERPDDTVERPDDTVERPDDTFEPVFETEPVVEAERGRVHEDFEDQDVVAEVSLDAAVPEDEWAEPAAAAPEEQGAAEPAGRETEWALPPASDEAATDRDPWSSSEDRSDAEAEHVAPAAPSPAVRGAAPPPRAPGPAEGEEFVDLAALLAEEDPQDGTRFRVQETAPTGDEDRDFAELLSQFKAKVSEHLPREDATAHYDLALAFKEMGLVDEAIAEFQIALRAGSMRLKVYEELGQCFLLKEQYNIAVKVLKTALGMQYDDELELLGVYYQLGRAYEGLGRRDDARDAYERVLGMDINFEDVTERLAQL